MENITYRPTWAEIDLNALIRNLESIRKVVGKKAELMAVVKANAYGHGICQVSHTLVEKGVNKLGVATVDEALKLRNSGITSSILVLGSVLFEEAKVAVENDITVTLCDERLVDALLVIAERTGKVPKVHIKVDTGMGRIGVWHEDAVKFVEHVASKKEINIEGIYTHFSSAARDKVFTTMQIESFNKVIKDIEEKGINIKYKHASNSVAIVDWKEARLNLVRTGIMLYGIFPKKDFYKKFTLEPVMSLKTRIVFLKNTPAGRAISYGRTYITQEPTKIATIPIGYADGYGRILSNKAEALVNGKYVRVVGCVTMDQTLLDVGPAGDVKVGDEVVLIGGQAGSSVHIEKIAKLSGTIPYEILSTITERVPRVYKR